MRGRKKIWKNKRSDCVSKSKISDTEISEAKKKIEACETSGEFFTIIGIMPWEMSWYLASYTDKLQYPL